MTTPHSRIALSLVALVAGSLVAAPLPAAADAAPLASPVSASVSSDTPGWGAHEPDAMAEQPLPATDQLPPPAWLPWQQRMQPEVVSTHAAAVWSLAEALDQLPAHRPTAPLPPGAGIPDLAGGTGAATGRRDTRRRDTSRRDTRPRRLDPLEYKWPIAPVDLVKPFKPPKSKYGRGHRGVDLRALPGTPVYAAGPGVVAFSGPINSVGNLSIQHTPFLRTTYQPLTARVPMFTPVIAGVPIGLLSPGGHCLPACLHWGAKTGPRSYIDPTLLPDFAPELKPGPPATRGPRGRR